MVVHIWCAQHSQYALKMIKKNDDEKEKQHIVTDSRYNMISISMNKGNKRTIFQHSQPIDSLPIISVYECVYARSHEWWEQAIVVSNPFSSQW